MAQDNKLIKSLIESSRSGSINAFEQLARMHLGYVYAISFRLLADSDDADESTTNIFVEVWKTISMVRRDSPFILWLKAIAIYSSLQKIRERKNTKIGKKHSPKRKGLGFIDQEILELPESERIVFVLHDIEHYKKEEISDLLSMTKEEVEYFHKKARETIMETLVLKSGEALERALKQIPETIDPLENLYIRIIDEISKPNSPEIKEEPASEKEKSFSFKKLFKKKNN